MAVVCGCGDDANVALDAPPVPTPAVTVTAPRLNEAFYMTDVARIEWQAVDFGAAVSCTVTASDGTTMVPIATGVTTGSAMWTLTAIPAATTYSATVTCTDAEQQTVATASGEFAVTGPAQAVSFATQILPLLTTCTGGSCHDDSGPQQGLELSPAVAHASLVGVASRECPTTQLVDPGDPHASYFLFKLRGNGPCMTGTRMPRGAPALTLAQLVLVRDWITNGAPNN